MPINPKSGLETRAGESMSALNDGSFPENIKALWHQARGFGGRSVEILGVSSFALLDMHAFEVFKQQDLSDLLHACIL